MMAIHYIVHYHVNDQMIEPSENMKSAICQFYR